MKMMHAGIMVETKSKHYYTNFLREEKVLAGNSFEVKFCQIYQAEINTIMIFSLLYWLLLKNLFMLKWGSEFSSYEIKLRNRVTQYDFTLRVTNSKSKIKKIHLELLTRRFNFYFSTSEFLTRGWTFIFLLPCS